MNDKELPLISKYAEKAAHQLKKNFSSLSSKIRTIEKGTGIQVEVDSLTYAVVLESYDLRRFLYSTINRMLANHILFNKDVVFRSQ
jgi:hypothetical protein